MLIRNITIELACGLMKGHNLVRRYLLPLTCVLLPVLILVLDSTFIPAQILMLAHELALASAVIEKSDQSVQPSIQATSKVFLPALIHGAILCEGHK